MKSFIISWQLLLLSRKSIRHNGRYDLNQKNAKEYGCEDQLEKIGGKIIKALLKDYDMTGDEALDIYQTRKRDDYTVKLHQKLKELGLG